MACCTQLLLYEMSADTHASGQSSFQELKSSVVVTDVYEADVSGPFRFLIEFRHKLDLPETYESRRFLNMGKYHTHTQQSMLVKDLQRMVLIGFLFSI